VGVGGAVVGVGDAVDWTVGAAVGAIVGDSHAVADTHSKSDTISG
jgi:hypothetical protein